MVHALCKAWSFSRVLKLPEHLRHSRIAGSKRGRRGGGLVWVRLVVDENNMKGVSWTLAIFQGLGSHMP